MVFGNHVYELCNLSPREVHLEAVSGHFSIYLGLDIYGGGACLHSILAGNRHT